MGELPLSSETFSLPSPIAFTSFQTRAGGRRRCCPRCGRRSINVITVDELSGENILGSASGPVSGRTDTSKDGKERTPRDVLGLASYKYQLYQTNSDVFMRYATMDAWAKFPDMPERYARYVQARIANDRELIGWYGTSAAADTDRSQAWGTPLQWPIGIRASRVRRRAPRRRGPAG